MVCSPCDESCDELSHIREAIRAARELRLSTFGSLLRHFLRRARLAIFAAKPRADLVALAQASARLAHSSTVEDEQMRKDAPVRARKERHEVEFDALWSCGAAQAKAVGEAFNMGVDHHAFVEAEAVSEHDIRGFSGDSAQLHQLVHRLRNFTSEAHFEQLRAFKQRARLAAKQANRADQRLDGEGGGERVILHAGKCAKESGGRAIHRDIGALRREDRREEELVRDGPVEFAMRIWVARLQRLEERVRSLSLCGGLSRKPLQWISHDANSSQPLRLGYFHCRSFPALQWNSNLQ